MLAAPLVVELLGFRTEFISDLVAFAGRKRLTMSWGQAFALPGPAKAKGLFHWLFSHQLGQSLGKCQL